MSDPNTYAPAVSADGSRQCPLCGTAMDYQPRTHWTGMRSIVTAERWVCSQSDGKGTRHFFDYEQSALREKP